MGTWAGCPELTGMRALPSEMPRGSKPCRISLSNSGPVGIRVSVMLCTQWQIIERIVRRTVLESLGLTKYYDSQNESMWYLFRLAEYPPPSKEEKQKIDKKLGYYPYQDTNTLSIINQIQTEGLELKTRDGEWIAVTPSPDSFIVLAGNSFRAWTNGRVYAPYHRILVGGEVTRYSSILFSIPPENDLLEAPEEVVDENHPSLFVPFNYNEFTRFCASEKGNKADDMLEAFCADVKA